MSQRIANKIIFVTGTDTGVGKTTLAALLLYHLRASGVRALAMKPFCSGGRADVDLLQSLQKGELSDSEVNPYYFSEPVAPYVALGSRRQRIQLEDVLVRINAVAQKCERLIIEGSGGVLVPLAKEFTVLDIITRTKPKVIVVARNQLGTINHTLLTVNLLQSKGLDDIAVLLVNPRKLDASSATNAAVIGKISCVPVFEMLYLANVYKGFNAVENSHKKIKKTLARLIA